MVEVDKFILLEKKVIDFIFFLILICILLTAWEQIYNPNFKVFESEHFREQVGLLTFTPSVTEWCDRTNAIGIYTKLGKYGGTYTHKDIVS